RVVTQWPDATDAGGLRTPWAFVGGDRQLDWIPYVQVLESFVDHRVSVKVHATAIVNLDETVALFTENIGDLPLWLTFVNFDLSVLLAAPLLQPALKSGKTVAQGHERIRVRIDIPRLPPDGDFGSRHTSLDCHLKLAGARGWPVHVDAPRRDVAVALLKLVDVLPDLRPDRLRWLHAMERQVEIVFALVNFHRTYPVLPVLRANAVAFATWICSFAPASASTRSVSPAMRKIKASIE